MSINVPPETYYVELFGSLLASDELNQLARELRKGRRSVVVSGLAGSARALVIAALEKMSGRRVVYVTRSNREVEEFQPDTEFFYCALNGLNSCETAVLAIPATETDPYNGTSPHAEVLEQRKDKKVIAFKYRRRKGYHRTVGHRRKLTRVKIKSINLGAKKAATNKSEE